MSKVKRVKEPKEDKSKKSKKKQFPCVAIVGPDGIEGNLSQNRRPLIVHLSIQSKDIFTNDMPITYDPNPPAEAIPYDNSSPFCEVESSPEIKTPDIKVNTDKVDTEIDYYNVKSDLLFQFNNYNDRKTIPDKSDAACFWCCHIFTNRPVVLPTRDTGEYLQVTGNYCSPECAAAYLFDMRQDSHTRWEQLSLLYRVYNQACNGKINPAPSRSILKLFGGNLSIQEYRGLIHSHKVRVDIHLPPMVSILATMDTKPIDFYDANLTKGVTETVNERLQKAEEVLRLRRTKPLKAWESTLDACLNLKINN